ncbi:rifin [Plasmodium reichenowi]|uniref:Rifin n=1 Tax=Plasmodium reichenowi TaxID=5854 RepID=A0A060RWB6_PLARE|nr:rifin [Plasmodium reichenowi]
MKLHCSKILLLFLPLNIFLTSYHAHNKNKIYITTHHTATTTSRVLSECDTQSSIYDNDADMKSVMEQFDDRTSQRLREYDERMQEKRQKRKEQRDKNVKKIIEKDKMDKSLTEKVEIGCLRCGCALGGVAAGVGIFGTVAVKELAKTATAAAVEGAQEAAIAEGLAAGAEAGKEFVIEELGKLYVSTLGGQELKIFFTTTDYTNSLKIISAINTQYEPSNCIFHSSGIRQPFCSWVMEKSAAAKKLPQMLQKGYVSHTELVQTHVNEIVAKATTHAAEVTKEATKEAIKASTLAAESTYANCQTAIIASVVAIIIIALVMIIIYLVLRYRRKKKMDKKAQYTKLLNQ